MSDDNNISLSNQRELLAENVRRKAQAQKLKAELDDARKQLDKIKADHAAELAQRDQMIQEFTEAIDSQVAVFQELGFESFDDMLNDYAGLAEWHSALGDDPQFKTLAEENESLRSSIRDGKHKDAFNAKAKELGFNPAALSDVWEQSGYKAESDDVDDAAIEAALKPLSESKPWLLKTVETPTPSAAAGTAEPSTGKTPTAQGTGGPMVAGVAPVGAKTLNLQPTAPGAGVGRGSPEKAGNPPVTVADRVNALFAASGRSDPTRI